jgi:hypothetical protein
VSKTIVFAAFGDDENDEPLYYILLVDIFCNLGLTLLLAAAVAYTFVSLVEMRHTFKLPFSSTRVFSCTDLEELLFFLAACLLTFGIASEHPVIVGNGCVQFASLVQCNQ